MLTLLGQTFISEACQGAEEAGEEECLAADIQTPASRPHTLTHMLTARNKAS